MAVKKRSGRPRKATASTTTTGAKRGRPAKKVTASAPAKRRGRPAKMVTATAPAKRRGRPAKMVTATAPKTASKTARKLTVGDCDGKLMRSRLVGGYALKKRVRKPKMATTRRSRK
jgi:hypothetical protein